jgi:hypothetical protein
MHHSEERNMMFIVMLSVQFYNSSLKFVVKLLTRLATNMA